MTSRERPRSTRLGSLPDFSSLPPGCQNERVSAFVSLVEVRLHFGESQDLKGKRKLVKSLKEQLRQRFGASVAEIDGHDTWQRTTLLCALVGDGERGRPRRRDGALHREPLPGRLLIRARCAQSCRTSAASYGAWSDLNWL